MIGGVKACRTMSGVLDCLSFPKHLLCHLPEVCSKRLHRCVHMKEGCPKNPEAGSVCDGGPMVRLRMLLPTCAVCQGVRRG